MKKVGGFIAGTFLLVLTAAFLIVGTVQSKSESELRKQEGYYVEMEREYVAEMRAYLDENGFRNSGVMLTRTVYEDGSRSYLISIHHKNFDKMSEEEKAALVEVLQEKAFEGENISFAHSLQGNA